MGPFATLKVEQLDGVTTIKFRDGSILDAVAIQRIAKELFEIVDSPGQDRLVLDFSEVRFFSSQALGTLMTLRRRADQKKARVVLAAVRPELMRVFKLTSLDRLFKFYSTTLEAGEALAPK